MKDKIMAAADAYAYQKALINVSQMLHAQILETDEARATLAALVEEVCRDAARYRWLREQPAHRTRNPDEDELVRTVCVDSWKGSFGKQVAGVECDAVIDAARGVKE